MTGDLGRTWTAATLGLCLAGCAGLADAAGFALIEQSGSGQGNAFAGGAASAEDASTIFYNPAGMTLLPGKQVVVAVHAIGLSTEFSNQGSTAPLGKPLGGTGGDAGDWSYLPNLYVSWALTPQWSVGVGVNVPFGLTTEYDPTWIGRYQAIKSDLKTVNINPAVAYKINDMISIGAGVNYQSIDAELTRAVNFSALFPDGSAKVEGDDTGWGWNAGALFNLGSDMRVGVAYRSAIHYTLEGNVSFGVPAGVPAGLRPPDGPIRADITVPETASVSVFQSFGERWDLMGDITWTRWNRFQDLNIYRTNGALLQATPEHWENTFRLALGLNYHLNERWKLRGGVAFDQSPVPDQYRTARIPDNDRTWASVGAQWKFTQSAALDIGYSHLFVKDSSISDNQGTGATSNGLLMGSYSNSVDIVSLQLTLSF